MTTPTTPEQLDLPSLGLGEVPSWGWAWHGPVYDGAIHVSGGEPVPVYPTYVHRGSGAVRKIKLGDDAPAIAVPGGGELRDYALVSGWGAGSYRINNDRATFIDGNPIHAFYKDPISGRVVAWSVLQGTRIDPGLTDEQRPMWIEAKAHFGEFRKRKYSANLEQVQRTLTDYTLVGLLGGGFLDWRSRFSSQLAYALMQLDATEDGTRVLYAVQGVTGTESGFGSLLPSAVRESGKRELVLTLAIVEAVASGSLVDGSFSVALTTIEPFSACIGEPFANTQAGTYSFTEWGLEMIECGEGKANAQRWKSGSASAQYKVSESWGILNQAVSAFYKDGEIVIARANWRRWFSETDPGIQQSASGLGCNDKSSTQSSSRSMSTNSGERWEITLNGAVIDALEWTATAQDSISWTYYDDGLPAPYGETRTESNWDTTCSADVFGDYTRQDFGLYADPFQGWFGMLGEAEAPELRPQAVPEMRTAAQVFMPQLPQYGDIGYYIHRYTPKCLGFVGVTRATDGGEVFVKARPVHTPTETLPTITAPSLASLPLYVSWHPGTGEVIRMSIPCSWA